MKRCTKCKQEKLLSEFYKKWDTKDGLQGDCKSCKAEYDRGYSQTHKVQKAKRHHKWYQKNKTERAEYNRGYNQTHREEIAEYNRTPVRIEGRKRADKRRREKSPEKLKARKAVYSEKRAGRMKPSVFCEECGLPAKTHGHHKDYSKPLDVDWLCKECHTELHRKLKAEEETT